MMRMVADDTAWLGLPTSKYYERAKKYLRRGFGGVLSFGVVGGTVGSKAFVDGLRLISNMTKYVPPDQGFTRSGKTIKRH